jgi:hypothetical protein
VKVRVVSGYKEEAVTVKSLVLLIKKGNNLDIFRKKRRIFCLIRQGPAQRLI